MPNNISASYNTLDNTPKTSNYNYNNFSSKNSSNDFGRKQMGKDSYIGKSAELKKVKDYNYNNDESYYYWF